MREIHKNGAESKGRHREQTLGVEQKEEIEEMDLDSLMPWRGAIK